MQGRIQLQRSRSDPVRSFRSDSVASFASMAASAETLFLRKHLFDRVDAQTTSRIEDCISEKEREFLWLVEVGDIESIKEFLQTANINTDCCDYRGQRALDLAVINRDPELVEYLLDHLSVTTLHYYCAVLRAVVEGDENILEMLLDRAEDDEHIREPLKDLIKGGPACTNCLPEVAATNLTPVMAAATAGNFEITRILLERGYTIMKPHSIRCHCKDYCYQRNESETLTESLSRINAYRALSSPTYLILTSEDPILSAFQLSKETKKLGEILPENQKEYQEMSTQCSKFAAALLNQCRNTEEVQTVLVQKKGFYDPRPHRFSRLHLAVQLGQTEFVTHSSCQQVLRSLWVENIASWYSWSFGWRAFYVLKHALMTPFVSVAFIFIPRAEIIQPLRVPLNRFIYAATSYLVFLTLLLTTLLNDRRSTIHTPVTWTEIAVGCFVLAHSWDILVNLMSVGFRTYFRSWWRVFDLVMFVLFLVSEILWLSVIIFSLLHVDGDLNSNRMNWHWYHPILIGESIYAMASVMAFSRLILWFQVNSRMGPLGTSIKYMIVDVFQLFLLFFIIMLAFATGINSIYKHYRDSTRLEDDEVLEQPDAFITLKNTFKYLFWAIFGMGEPDYAQIVVGGNSSSPDHLFSEGVGYTLWGLYHLVCVVVLLNMLIAMMTESYQRVQANADMEWKFACSTLWLSILDNQSVVPAPFNLIPSMHKVVLLVKWSVALFRGTFNGSPGKVSWSPKRCFYWESSVDEMVQKAEEEKYEKLMVQLIRRYLHKEPSAPICKELREELREQITQDLRRSFNLQSKRKTRRRRPKAPY